MEKELHVPYNNGLVTLVPLSLTVSQVSTNILQGRNGSTY